MQNNGSQLRINQENNRVNLRYTQIGINLVSGSVPGWSVCLGSGEDVN